MGHDHHFLERLDRVESAHLEYALGLYRDHEAVHYVLKHAGAEGERIALSIASPTRGPFVVIARNGAFVTCLAEGMTVRNLAVVPREKVDALIARHKELRTREQIAEDLRREGEHTRDFFKRIFDRANEICREEFMALAAFAPLFAGKYYQAASTVSIDVFESLSSLGKIAKVKPIDVPVAKSAYRSYWFLAHALPLSTLGDEGALDSVIPGLLQHRVTFTVAVALLGSVTHLFRGAWASAHIGDKLIDSYAGHLSWNFAGPFYLDDVAALGAIAVRHPKSKGRVVDILTKARTTPEKQEGLEARALALDLMIAILDDPERFKKESLAFGRYVYTVLSNGLEPDDPMRIDEAENVPDDLARTALLGLDADLLNHNELVVLSLMAIPLVASARAEEFYFERDRARKLYPAWTPEATLELVDRQRQAGHLGGITVSGTAKQGRNEPCSCGSGKKYKKCHGAG